MKKTVKILLIIVAIIILILGIATYYIINKLNKVNYVDISKEEIEITDGVRNSYKVLEILHYLG